VHLIIFLFCDSIKRINELERFENNRPPMLMKGEALIGTFTLAFTVSGERGNWTVAVSGPSGETLQDETCERSWHVLFDELLAEACAAARRQRTALASGARR
jgi:hypothetical protein